MNTSAVRMAAVRTARAYDWKPFVKNTLGGFFSLTLPSGMIVHDLTLHAKNDSRWVGMPSEKFTKSDDSVSYTHTIEFVDRAAADRFSRHGDRGAKRNRGNGVTTRKGNGSNASDASAAQAVSQ